MADYVIFATRDGEAICAADLEAERAAAIRAVWFVGGRVLINTHFEISALDERAACKIYLLAAVVIARNLGGGET